MALTDAAIKQALPKATDYWMTDARGLRLLEKPNVQNIGASNIDSKATRKHLQMPWKLRRAAC